MTIHQARRLFLVLIGIVVFGAGAAESAGQETPGPEKVSAAHLPNPWRIHAKVISGGLPEGPEAFAELQRLGIKTIISVDGAKPDVKLAKEYGLRYVHLPHGYDGVPEERAAELAKAVRDLPGPIYIHCHHGKHRSPAAATVACVGAGLLPPERARGVLEAAGTSENYRGLYDSAEAARPLETAWLDALQVEYRETVKVPPMAQAMIEIEHTFDHLRAFSNNQWRKLDKQPALDPAHEALILREHYTELLRTEETKRQPAEFQQLLRDSEASAQKLEILLARWQKAGAAPPPPAEMGATFKAVSQSCVTCHQSYRDVPQGEKRRSTR